MPLVSVQDNILPSRLGLGINFIQWIPLRSNNDTQFIAVALFVVTPGLVISPNKRGGSIGPIPV